MSEQVGKSIESSQEGVDSIDTKQQDRTYNPVDQAERGSVSEKLNSDAAKYKKGPGPT